MCLCSIHQFVEEDLQDNGPAGVSFELKEGVHTVDDLLRQDPDAIQAAMAAYQTSETRPLCSGGVSSFVFMPVVEFIEDNGRANLKSYLDGMYKRSRPLNTRRRICAISTYSLYWKILMKVQFHSLPSRRRPTLEIRSSSNPSPENFSLGIILLPPSLCFTRFLRATYTSCPQTQQMHQPWTQDISLIPSTSRYSHGMCATWRPLQRLPCAPVVKPNGRRNAFQGFGLSKGMRQGWLP